MQAINFPVPANVREMVKIIQDGNTVMARVEWFGLPDYAKARVRRDDWNELFVEFELISRKNSG